MADHALHPTHDTQGHGDAHGHGDSHGHDSWHRHDASEPAPQEAHGTINALTLFQVLVVVIGGTAVFILLTVMYFNREMGALYTQRTEPDLQAEYNASKSAAQARLASYGWVDAGSGTVSIPLDLAKNKVLKDYSAK
jgi:hypothetical protein